MSLSIMYKQDYVPRTELGQRMMQIFCYHISELSADIEEEIANVDRVLIRQIAIINQIEEFAHRLPDTQHAWADHQSDEEENPQPINPPKQQQDSSESDLDWFEDVEEIPKKRTIPCRFAYRLNAKGPYRRSPLAYRKIFKNS